MLQYNSITIPPAFECKSNGLMRERERRGERERGGGEREREREIEIDR